MSVAPPPLRPRSDLAPLCAAGLRLDKAKTTCHNGITREGQRAQLNRGEKSASARDPLLSFFILKNTSFGLDTPISIGYT